MALTHLSSTIEFSLIQELNRAHHIVPRIRKFAVGTLQLIAHVSLRDRQPMDALAPGLVREESELWRRD